MKAFLATIAMLSMITTAHATGLDLSGKTVELPAKVKVLNSKGEIKEYLTPVSNGKDIPGSIYATNNYVSVGIGATSRCSPAIGTLAEDVIVTVVNNEGQMATVIIQADSSVTAFGTCQGKSNQLLELTLQASDLSKVQIHTHEVGN